MTSLELENFFMWAKKIILRPFLSVHGRCRRGKITSSMPDAELCTRFEPMTILVELIQTDNFLYILLQGGTVLKYHYNLQ